jgi:hypothetical protein
MLIQYVIWFILILFFSSMVLNKLFFSDIKEGANSIAADTYTVDCDKLPTDLGIQESVTDKNVNSAISDYISVADSLLIKYIMQLNEILNKFEDVSTALSVGTIDVSSPQTQPIINISDPVDNKINQIINFVLPKGNAGPKGDDPLVGPIKGPDGRVGEIGEQGPTGIYAIIEQQKRT